MLKIYVLLIIDVLLAAGGQMLLKRGVNLIGSLDFTLRNIPVLISAAIKNVYIWLAMVAYALAMLLWLFIISKVKLSVAYPATALIYVFIVVGAWLIFREKITANQLVGIAIILVGMFFLFKDSLTLQ